MSAPAGEQQAVGRRPCRRARRPSAGATASAELPPVTRPMTGRPGWPPGDLEQAQPAARDSSSSGTGCDASRTSMCRSGRPWPRFTTTTPAAMRSPSSSSSTAAMPIVALPAPSDERRARPRRSKDRAARPRRPGGVTTCSSTGGTRGRHPRGDHRGAPPQDRRRRAPPRRSASASRRSSARP